MSTLLASPFLRIAGSSIAALLGYGSWAFIANVNTGINAAYKAGFTQGCYALLLTLTLAFFIESVFAHLRQWRFGRAATLIMTCGLMYSASWSINLWMGTPHILLTILPGAFISTLYTAGYLTLLSRQPNPAPLSTRQ